MSFLFTALGIGLAGSFHCVGMCGPIALALPFDRHNAWKAFGAVMLYNGGRVVTYSFIGLLTGSLGQGLFLAGLQSWFAIGTGIFLILAALFSINVENKILTVPLFSRFYLNLKNKLGKILGQRSNNLFYVGLLNGFLPCGLVYMAVVGALATISIWQGILYMLFFGLGTIPLMAITAFSPRFVPIALRHKIKKFFPFLLVLIAALFLLRGISFHVPPEVRFWDDMQNIPMCH